MDTWGLAHKPSVFDALVAAYSEKWRHYHTIEHISACLRHLDAVAHELDAPHEVEMALWFHDAVYKPLSGNNERESADWAMAFLIAEGAEHAAAARVHRLIMATRHGDSSQAGDEASLVDIDLSILGTDPPTYNRYEQQIRKEYTFVPSFIYRKKRAAILRDLLGRPRIYTSGHVAAATERQARANLLNAVSALEAHH
jgi:predicted metal-dependent HD superfamily phosphohydrolase